MNRLNPTLQIDTEFAGKIPPLTADEYRKLEENIVLEGAIISPIIVWNDTIVDGHNRYKIAQSHPEVVFTVHKKDFANRYEALAWICKNQLGRRNLTPEQRKYLIGNRYEAEKMAHGGDRKSAASKSTDKKCPLISSHATRFRIASETNTSESYVREAGKFAKGVDAAEEVAPGIKDEILSGKIKPTQKEIQALIKASPVERNLMVECLHLPRKRAPVSKVLLDAAQQISDDMAAQQRQGMAEQDAVRQFEWQITQTLQFFDDTFDEWPQLIYSANYCNQIIATLQDLKQYILHIEGGTRYEWNCKKRKIV